MSALADGSVGQALALENADVAALRETALLLLQQAAGRGDAQRRLQVAATVVGPPRKERGREDLAIVFRLTASMLRDIEAINSGVEARLMANPIVADDLRFLQTVVRAGVPKVTIASPPVMHYFLGPRAADPAAYPDIEEYFGDLARIYREELGELAAVGCRFVQLDDTALAIPDGGF